MLQRFVFRFFSVMIILLSLSLSLIKPITLIRQYAYSNYLVWNKPDIQAYQKKKECKIYTVSRRCLEFQKKNKQTKKQSRMIGPE